MIYDNADALHFRQVSTLLRRRWLLIALVTLFGGVVVGAAAFLLPPTYTAKAQMLLVSEIRDGVETMDDAAVATFLELLRSPDQLRRLATNLEEADAVAEDAMGLPGYEALEERLRVFKEHGSRLISVTFSSSNPEVAATVANKTIEVYLDGVTDRLEVEHDKALHAVAARLETARDDLDRTIDELRVYRVANGVIDAGRADEIDIQIGQMSRQLSIASAELATREAQLRSVGENATRVANVDARGAVVVGDPARGDAAGGNVKAQSLRVDRDELERARAEAVARVGDIDERLNALRAAGAAAGEQQIQLRELEREVTAAEEAYESLIRRRADLVSRGPGRPPARIVSLAEVPEVPSSPNPLLFLFPAIVGTAAIGAMVALLLERADQRLRSEQDVEDTLQVPCIGLVPKRPRTLAKDPSDILPQDPFTPYVEAVRAISVAARKRVGSALEPRTFLVTSVAEGDGATTTAVAFALYAARLNRRVLLMDLNVRRLGVAAALGEPEPEELLDEPPENAIRRVEALGVDYLSPLRRDADPLTVLCTDEFPELLTRLAKTYDYIVIDSAPAASATETRLLASMVDRVLFVVKWGATEARAAQAALHGLRAMGGFMPVVSVVIAQADMRRHARHRYGEERNMTTAVQRA
ncbi:Wzz/FepE/Etk N-terminal domain-containing protein [Defluviimonas sp. WL0024]|uniref:Wzz/FepE/Etk N-terminal domain-containing protein n=2 Tax=Albidovulum TaxID=205889 RepID=A0ABT3IYY5_9RHOB|nr:MULTISPECIES: Wzz/FepE/Etk N-terminal domain-containing protein [Defluviimonas]MCU9848372.1 Wzz/FepE/Etk N-terminal domain-containing protein [Defluviimonas sp. WL0024]MCW3780642.1 Wzz/FepE/Etk N-terminal domain-containing protein [Defluviimonas salinarum]